MQRLHQLHERALRARHCGARTHELEEHRALRSHRDRAEQHRIRNGLSRLRAGHRHATGVRALSFDDRDFDRACGQLATLGFQCRVAAVWLCDLTDAARLPTGTLWSHKQIESPRLPGLNGNASLAAWGLA